MDPCSLFYVCIIHNPIRSFPFHSVLRFWVFEGLVIVFFITFGFCLSWLTYKIKYCVFFRGRFCSCPVYLKSWMRVRALSVNAENDSANRPAVKFSFESISTSRWALIFLSSLYFGTMIYFFRLGTISVVFPLYFRLLECIYSCLAPCIARVCVCVCVFFEFLSFCARQQFWMKDSSGLFLLL